MRPSPSVEVVIPHWSRRDLLVGVLEALGRQSVVPAICVVDNASTDGTLTELANRPDVRLVQMRTNTGFARAVNAGIRSSDADYVITLNNDMEPEPAFVEAMLSSLRSGVAAVAGGVQLRPDGLVDTVGVAVDQSLCAYDVGHGLPVDQALDDGLRPLGPSGGAAGFVRSVFLDLGGYDEHFFAYLEDVDLALRLRAAGVPFAVARDARVWHRHSSTLGAGSRAKNRLMGFSRGYLIAKYGAELSRSARYRGYLIDAVVYAGQAAVDRNVGAIEGRIACARSRPSPPPARPVASELQRLSLSDALTRRLGRRVRRGPDPVG